jgi:O-antigen/teichoic acid export membrane protein
MDLQSHLRFGGKLALTSVAAFVVARSGVLLLDAFGNDASVGTYAVASRIGDMLMFIPNTVSGIVLARLSASPDRAFRYAETVRFAKSLTGLVAGVALLVALAGPWAIPFVFGREYSSSYLPLVVLLPGLIFLTTELVLAQNLAAAGVPRAVVGLWFLVAVLSIVLGLFLVPRLGPAGVALSATATYGVLLFGIWRIHARLRT